MRWTLYSHVALDLQLVVVDFGLSGGEPFVRDINERNENVNETNEAKWNENGKFTLSRRRHTRERKNLALPAQLNLFRHKDIAYQFYSRYKLECLVCRLFLFSSWKSVERCVEKNRTHAFLYFCFFFFSFLAFRFESFAANLSKNAISNFQIKLVLSLTDFSLLLSPSLCLSFSVGSLIYLYLLLLLLNYKNWFSSQFFLLSLCTELTVFFLFRFFLFSFLSHQNRNERHFDLPNKNTIYHLWSNN